jgi:hypothetical protein
MNVVGHKRPGKTFGAGFDKKLREIAQKALPVVIVTKEVASFHTADDNVLQQIWDIDTGGPWHGWIVAKMAGQNQSINK